MPLINLGNLQIDGRLLASLIEGVKQAARLGVCSGLPTLAFFGEGIQGIINAVLAA